MRFSDIKVRYIYNVIFDDVRYCEFNGRHLALVLKRNNDNQTYIVMPLTSESNGNGTNKFKIGEINSLPTSLRSNETYAVYNQVRTVNANRFISLKQGTNVVESKIDDLMFCKLLNFAVSEIMFNLNQDEKINILKDLYENEAVAKAKDLAYTIIKLKKEIQCSEEKIKSLEKEIKETLNNIPYKLEQKYIDDGISFIFDNILKK